MSHNSSESELQPTGSEITSPSGLCFERFSGSVVSGWVLHFMDLFELPMQLCLLKCILLLKNKRNNLYSLTKVLKKMNFLVSQQIFPKLILSLQILVFYLQTFIGFRGGGDLIKSKVQLHLKQKPALQTTHRHTHWFMVHNKHVGIYTETKDIPKPSLTPT